MSFLTYYVENLSDNYKFRVMSYEFIKVKFLYARSREETDLLLYMLDCIRYEFIKTNLMFTESNVRSLLLTIIERVALKPVQHIEYSLLFGPNVITLLLAAQKKNNRIELFFPGIPDAIRSSHFILNSIEPTSGSSSTTCVLKCDTSGYCVTLCGHIYCHICVKRLAIDCIRIKCAICRQKSIVHRVY